MSHDHPRRTHLLAARHRNALRAPAALLATLSLLIGALTTSVTAPSAAAAHAPDACRARAVAPVLTSFEDPSLYFLAPGGSFETGTTSWSAHKGVRLAAENEPWQVVPGRSSLVVSPGSAVSSPPVCVGQGEDSLRMFVKAPGRPGARLAVTATAVSAKGTRSTTTLIDGSRAGWVLTPALSIPDTTGGAGTQSVRISFSTRGSGTFLVDDVLIDPWRIS